MNMMQKKNGSEVALQSERLGSEKKIQAVLADWGMDKAAIRYMLDEHQARQSSVRKDAVKSRISHAPAISSSSPSR
jgi:hypothetical protein